MDKGSSNKGAAGGVGFCGLLTIAFIVLKLTGVIAWSWWWVLSPIWITAAITVGILLIMLITLIVVTVVKTANENKRSGR